MTSGVRAAGRAAGAVAAVLLAAGCGGAGGGDLSVNYFYLPVSCPRFGSCTVTPSTEGLGGKSATFTLSGGSLPPGFTLDARSGIITGAPATLGSWAAQITLTVSGYDGSLVSTASIEGAPVFLVYDPMPDGLNQVAAYRVGLPIPPAAPHLIDRPAIDFLPGTAYEAPLAAGVTRTFSLAPGSTLPAGLSLDPATGVISGAPQDPAGGGHGPVVQARYTYQGVSADLSSPLGIWVDPLPTFFTWDTGRDATVYFTDGTPISVAPAPYWTGATPGIMVTGFRQVGGTLPAGLSLDYATGVVSGMPATGAFSGTRWTPVVEATLVQGTATAPVTNGLLTFVRL